MGNASRDRWLRNLQLLLTHRHTIDAVGDDGLIRLRGVMAAQPTTHAPDRERIKALDGGQRALLMGMSTLTLPKESTKSNLSRTSTLRHSLSWSTRGRLAGHTRVAHANRPLTRVDSHGLL